MCTGLRTYAHTIYVAAISLAAAAAAEVVAVAVVVLSSSWRSHKAQRRLFSSLALPMGKSNSVFGLVKRKRSRNKHQVVEVLTWNGIATAKRPHNHSPPPHSSDSEELKYISEINAKRRRRRRRRKVLSWCGRQLAATADYYFSIRKIAIIMLALISDGRSTKSHRSSHIRRRRNWNP